MEITAVSNLTRTPEASSADQRRQAPKRHIRRKKQTADKGITYAPDGRLDEETSRPHIDITA
jgi:hypothetical protein